MCCLFGFYHYGEENVGKLSTLTNLLAVYHGYSPDEIDMLISEGFAPEEIEDFLYQAD